MKRLLALLMILVMIFSFAGCKSSKEKNEPEYADGQQPQGINADLTAFQGKLILPTIQLIASRNFFYQRIEQDGTIVTFTCIGQDEKLTLSQGASIIKTADGRLYYVDGNYYFEITDTLVKESGLTATLEQIKTVLASYEALIFGMLELVPMTVEGNALDVQGFVHEEYTDVENGMAYSFFFDANTKELASVAEVTASQNQAIYQVKTGVPSANAISNIFTNGTLVDSQEVLNEAANTLNGETTTAAQDTTAAQTTP